MDRVCARKGLDGWCSYGAMGQGDLLEVYEEEQGSVSDGFVAAHTTETVLNLLSMHNSKVAVVPGGCTSKLQPLDVSLNKPFKQICQKEFSLYCCSLLANMPDTSSQDSFKTNSVPVGGKSAGVPGLKPRNVCKIIQSYWDLLVTGWI